ncbi:MAG: hypothetical protein EB078_04560 [Proteobacteria bacterium]|nr:hypothetical protein [Pseudomonadota bacterium]NDC24109.1 hypothetical protein [Pseudomonadota bacterium]NDD04155.1 hypothetical protein [Pseudomonadota bacterium]NDG26564.1 hypothetical protein [Pseudomonadota bacterium]
MKHFIILILLVLCCQSPVSVAMGNRGDFIGSAGIGLLTSPTLFLLSPELEYVHNQDLNIGALAQMGLGEGGVLFTASGKVRHFFGGTPRVKPCVEGGLGLSMSSSLFSSAVGVHIEAGMGFDYVLEKNMTIGTMIRLNFSPPLKSFFLSWPIVTLRFLL